jgi:general secretion pathway protein G
LIEVLIVIVVIAILAAIVIPRLLGAGRSAREASLLAHLQEMRNAIALFQAQCGMYPAALSDLMATTAPSYVHAPDYQGPYLTTPDGNLPNDPLTGAADWNYSSSSGAIHSSATGNNLAGTAYTAL